jgi:hypothetical protein
LEESLMQTEELVAGKSVQVMPPDQSEEENSMQAEEEDKSMEKEEEGKNNKSGEEEEEEDESMQEEEEEEEEEETAKKSSSLKRGDRKGSIEIAANQSHSDSAAAMSDEEHKQADEDIDADVSQAEPEENGNGDPEMANAEQPPRQERLIAANRNRTSKLRPGGCKSKRIAINKPDSTQSMSDEDGNDVMRARSAGPSRLPEEPKTSRIQRQEVEVIDDAASSGDTKLSPSASVTHTLAPILRERIVAHAAAMRRSLNASQADVEAKPVVCTADGFEPWAEEQISRRWPAHPRGQIYCKDGRIYWVSPGGPCHIARKNHGTNTPIIWVIDKTNRTIKQICTKEKCERKAGIKCIYRAKTEDADNAESRNGSMPTDPKRQLKEVNSNPPSESDATTPTLWTVEVVPILGDTHCWYYCVRKADGIEIAIIKIRIREALESVTTLDELVRLGFDEASAPEARGNPEAAIAKIKQTYLTHPDFLQSKWGDTRAMLLYSRWHKSNLSFRIVTNRKEQTTIVRYVPPGLDESQMPPPTREMTLLYCNSQGNRESVNNHWELFQYSFSNGVTLPYWPFCRQESDTCKQRRLAMVIEASEPAIDRLFTENQNKIAGDHAMALRCSQQQENGAASGADRATVASSSTDGRARVLPSPTNTARAAGANLHCLPTEQAAASSSSPSRAIPLPVPPAATPYRSAASVSPAATSVAKAAASSTSSATATARGAFYSYEPLKKPPTPPAVIPAASPSPISSAAAASSSAAVPPAPSRGRTAAISAPRGRHANPQPRMDDPADDDDDKDSDDRPDSDVDSEASSSPNGLDYDSSDIDEEEMTVEQAEKELKDVDVMNPEAWPTGKWEAHYKAADIYDMDEIARRRADRAWNNDAVAMLLSERVRLAPDATQERALRKLLKKREKQATKARFDYLNKHWVIIAKAKPPYMFWITQRRPNEPDDKDHPIRFHEQTLHGFRESTKDRFIHIKIINPGTGRLHMKKKPQLLTEYWEGKRLKRSYDSTEFRPFPCGQEIPQNNSKFNRWRGFRTTKAAAAAYVQKLPAGEYERQLNLFKNHITQIWCRGDTQAADQISKHFAHIFQKPHIKTGVAISVLGLPGGGKGIIAQKIRDCIGHNYCTHFMSPEQVTGQFTGPFWQELLLGIVDEVYLDADINKRSKTANKMKTAISEKEHKIENKYCSAYQSPSYSNFFLFSNNPHMIDVELHDRRYFQLETADTYSGPETKESTEYFTMLDAVPEEIISHWLFNLPIDDFSPKQYQSTQALVDQKVSSLRSSSVEAWMLEKLREGQLPGFGSISCEESFMKANLDKWGDAWEYIRMKTEIYRDYKKFAGASGLRDNKFWTQLQILLPEMEVSRHELRYTQGLRGKVGTVQFPSRSRCRALIAQRLRLPEAQLYDEQDLVAESTSSPLSVLAAAGQRSLLQMPTQYQDVWEFHAAAAAAAAAAAGGRGAAGVGGGLGTGGQAAAGWRSAARWPTSSAVPAAASMPRSWEVEEEKKEASYHNEGKVCQ